MSGSTASLFHSLRPRLARFGATVVLVSTFGVALGPIASDAQAKFCSLQDLRQKFADLVQQKAKAQGSFTIAKQPGGVASSEFVERRSGAVAAGTTFRDIDKTSLDTFLARNREGANRKTAHWITDADSERFAERYEKGYATHDRVFLEIENPLLKQMNDQHIGPDLADAVSAKFRQFLFAEFDRYPHLKRSMVDKYYNVKTLRFAFNAKTFSGTSELFGAYKRAGYEFETWLRTDRSLLTQSGKRIGLYDLVAGRRGMLINPRTWHLAGFGSTIEEASLAARQARFVYGTLEAGSAPVLEFRNVFDQLDEKLIAAERAQRQLDKITRFKKTGLLSYSTKSRHWLLSVDALDEIRKLEVPEGTLAGYYSALRTRFSARFGVELTEPELKTISEYYQSTDLFSPPLFPAARQPVAPEKAVNGFISIDYRGLGAMNGYAEREGLFVNLHSSMDRAARVRSAVTSAAENRNDVTAYLKDQYALFDRKMAAVDPHAHRRYSGDEVVHPFSKIPPGRTEYLTEAEKHHFVEGMATDGPAAATRIVHVPRYFSPDPLQPGAFTVIPPAMRQGLRGTGEKTEKALRRLVDDSPAFRQLSSQLLIFVDVWPASARGGEIKLIIGGHAAKNSELIKQLEAWLPGVLEQKVPGWHAGDVLPAGTFKKVPHVENDAVPRGLRVSYARSTGVSEDVSVCDRSATGSVFNLFAHRYLGVGLNDGLSYRWA